MKMSTLENENRTNETAVDSTATVEVATAASTESNNMEKGKGFSAPEKTENEEKNEMKMQENDTNPPDKVKKLKKLEKAIRHGLTSYTKIGYNLKVIRDEQLYMTQKYSTFERYCLERFDISSTHAYRLIRHYEICVILQEDYLIIPEKVVRPLSVLKDEEMKTIWQAAREAKKGNSIPTAHDIEKRVEEFKNEMKAKNKEEGEIFVKKYGNLPLATLATSLIAKTETIQDLLVVLEEVKCVLSPEQKDEIKKACLNRLENVFTALTVDNAA